MRGRRRRNNWGAGQSDVHKTGIGHVHPSPPTTIKNPIRMIDHHANRKVRMEDYVRKHKSGAPG